MVKAKVFIFSKQFDGLPKEGDLKIIEEELPQLQDGEFLAEAVALSVDPYMRAYAPSLPLGSPYIGLQVALVKESKNPKFPVGKYVVGSFGWRSDTIMTHMLDKNTAYFGFLEICQPKSGQTVVVTGAAGAVGNHVGQIAKIKGCKVIGIAGSDEKGKWLKEELKFDHFINYKTDNIDEALKEIAPEGVDCYFDNVGGEISSIVLRNMNTYGRISVCGSISGYNEKTYPQASIVQWPVVSKQLKMEGFIVYRWIDRWMEGIEQNIKWIKEGKLKYKETVTNGFENMFEAFTNMLQGGNIGKAVVIVK